ncbi:type II toxin-antitoxin system VapC family toxin [Candidatus Woesearchaeota archaeon]|nr:type II toxin-antitoxin system VapC family toxin [Candidatus Woesearchaeota archaeon]
MENKICLDTDFLINFLRGKEEEINFIINNEAALIFATTPINLFELYLGAYQRMNKNELGAIDELSNRIRILNLSNAASNIAARDFILLRKRGLELDFRDVLISAIAKTENFCLKTNNKKHFERIPALKIMQ